MTNQVAINEDDVIELGNELYHSTQMSKLDKLHSKLKLNTKMIMPLTLITDKLLPDIHKQ